MRLNIEEECFSRLSRLVDFVGCEAREALGTLAFLWHDSQDILKTHGTFDEVIDWCRLNKCTQEMQNKWIAALCKARFLTETDAGVFLIHGNETQIDNRLKHYEKSKKGADATRKKWEQFRANKEGHRPATGTPQAGHCHAPTTPKTKQSKTKQENTLYDSAESHREEFNLEQIYQEYPRRRGQANKGKGIEKLRKLIKSRTDFELALAAVRGYRLHLISQGKVNTEFVKMFSSFWDSQGDWKEWAAARPSDGAEITDKLIAQAKGEL
jgi:heme-degrading monooxygenase HmoA